MKFIKCNDARELLEALLEHGSVASSSSYLELCEDGITAYQDGEELTDVTYLKDWINTGLAVRTCWYDYLDKQQVLCWVSDYHPVECIHLALIIGYEDGAERPFKAIDGLMYKYATPVPANANFLWRGAKQ